ncbi:hypothetical protein F1559_004897 [Cyanidiococcus yangmingshanensis]|uniref:Amine oxidase domain-containing protein n=1 Tax=Cyanidiococcus yangmingshanensis TaxID=2690220 RepID=A0A7J7IPE9_9RHOD|nr:hypothetical protein F1559_004897 [Cyanidiococcus yangmingshanensis]
MFVTSTPWKLHAPIERSCNRNRYPRRRQWLANVNEKDDSARLRVAIVGGGWAGLGAAHALSSAETNRRAFQVTLIESREAIGGLAAGWEQREKRPVEVGVHGFWRPYTNLFDLVYRQLDLPGGDPFTTFTRSAQYSPAGLEAESPLFGDLPRLPSPLGTFFYPRFYRLPLRDRLSALALFDAVVDFDNSVEAWQKYDRMTARELFIRYGCTERLIRGALEPMLLVGLFAPSELCSASGALGMLYYFILAHQGDFDVKWVRGTTAERIFEPWVRTMTHRGGLDLRLGTRVIDVCFHPTEGGIDALVLRVPMVAALSWTLMQSSSVSASRVRRRLSATQAPWPRNRVSSAILCIWAAWTSWQCDSISIDDFVFRARVTRFSGSMPASVAHSST